MRFFSKFFLLPFALFALLINAEIGNSQNLIPNPSFEDTLACPDGTNQVDKAVGWVILNNTPDYFNKCSTNPDVTVPLNIFGYQQAASGNGYCGFYTYSTVVFYRELIGCSLLFPLQIGVKYFITFKLNAAEFSSNCGTNKTGILFSTIPYSLGSPPPINNFSQIYTDSIISDTMNWVTVRKNFIADSNYTFISIGNFFDDLNTDTIHIFQSPNYVCYQKIDDLCISIDSVYCSTFTGINSIEKSIDNFTISPNPAFDYIKIRSKIISDKSLIRLLDFNGKFIKEQKLKPVLENEVKIDNLRNGLYIIELIDDKNIFHFRFLKL